MLNELPSLYTVTGDIKDINTLLISREAVRLNATVPEGMVLVNRGALNLVINALRRDAEEGRQVRGEMADLLSEAPRPAQQPLTDEPANGYVQKLMPQVSGYGQPVETIVADAAQRQEQPQKARVVLGYVPISAIEETPLDGYVPVYAPARRARSERLL
jgi:hypothetical protein